MNRIAFLLLLLAGNFFLLPVSIRPKAVSVNMTKAAVAFLQSLSPEQKAKAQFAFDRRRTL